MKKAIFILLVLFALLLLGGNFAYATIIGEEVYYSLPLMSKMETVTEAAYINNQISASGSSQLVLGGVTGKYAVKVTANETEGDISYTLVSSNIFTIKDYSQVHLWVKPGLGAQWLEFSTSTSAPKRYAVGEDLISGKWNEITLNLTEIVGELTVGENLYVKTNDNSIWFFDDVSSIATKVYSFDLSQMVNAKTEIANGGLQFMDTSATGFDTIPTILNSQQIALAQDRKITGIKINSTYANTSGDIGSLPSSVFFQFPTEAATPTVFALSGDGSKLYYANPADLSTLYCLNVMTGERTKISDYRYVIEIKVNYDGNVVLYFSSNTARYYLYDVNYGSTTLSVDTIACALAKDGTLYYKYKYGSQPGYLYKRNRGQGDTRIYTFPGSIMIATDIQTSFDDKYVYVATRNNGGGSHIGLIRLEDINMGPWHSTTIASRLPSGDNTYEFKLSSRDNNTILTIDGIYNFSANTFRKVNYFANSIKLCAFTGNDIYLKSSSVITAKNIISGIETNYALPNALTHWYITPLADKVAYSSKPGSNYGITIKSLEPVKGPEKYLLSFDGKLSWYSYQDGSWLKVSTGTSPSADTFNKYGMTKSEINNLTKGDFDKLYAGGGEVYSVNLATYFASVDCYTTPSIKSIDIITRNSTEELKGNASYSTLYAAKNMDFDATSWRKIKKIYPIELTPKSAGFYYYIYSDSNYRVYKNGNWQTVPDAAIHLSDVETHWLDITLEAMTAEELRSTPESSLTSELAGKEFSVVYPIRVTDKSTVAYSSKINIDYVESLFSSSNLTLNITLYGSPTPLTYTNLTVTQIEDFMEWLNARQFNQGPIYYRINNGTTSDFINYYMIQRVSVN